MYVIGTLSPNLFRPQMSGEILAFGKGDDGDDVGRCRMIPTSSTPPRDQPTHGRTERQLQRTVPNSHLPLVPTGSRRERLGRR